MTIKSDGLIAGDAIFHGSIGSGAINLSAARSSAIFSTAGSGPLSDAGADKILAALKPAKPRKIVKWKGVALAAQAKLNHNRCHSGHETLPLVLWDCPECHNETRRARDAALIALAKMERKAGRYFGWMVWGWLFALALLIARMVGK